MKRRILYRRALYAALFLTLAAIVGYYVYYLREQIPENIHMVAGREEQFDFSLPVQGEGDATQVGAINLDQKVMEGQLHLDFRQPFTLRAEHIGNMELNMKLFGILPLREIKVNVVEAQEVIPCGMAVGIYVETDGLLVLGTGEILGENGDKQEPAKNVIQSGDYILAANGSQVGSTRELQNLVEECAGEAMVLDIRRNGQDSKVKILPITDSTGSYKAGIWVRDSTQGIGTLTFVTMQEQYAALGHGITDVDTGVLMEVGKGYLYRAKILTITKGEAGVPGELVGVINKAKSARLGYIENNTSDGISGSLVTDVIDEIGVETIPLGFRQEVKTGKAWIRSYVSGEKEDYEIEIEELEQGSGEKGKGMVIRVTDERLLELSGGIVQGMSGSPIIQDGKLVGAVTHVLVNDPTRGYGIFIENMLDAAR